MSLKKGDIIQKGSVRVEQWLAAIGASGTRHAVDPDQGPDPQAR
jgi:hypothetical protein